MPTMRMEALQHQANSSCLQLIFKQQTVQLEAWQRTQIHSKSPVGYDEIEKFNNKDFGNEGQ